MLPFCAAAETKAVEAQGLEGEVDAARAGKLGVWCIRRWLWKGEKGACGKKDAPVRVAAYCVHEEAVIAQFGLFGALIERDWNFAKGNRKSLSAIKTMVKINS